MSKSSTAAAVLALTVACVIVAAYRRGGRRLDAVSTDPGTDVGGDNGVASTRDQQPTDRPTSVEAEARPSWANLGDAYQPPRTEGR